MAIPPGRARAANAVFVALSMAGFGAALLAVIGYLYGLPMLYRPIPEGSIAVHTALGFLVIFAGVAATRADLGWFALVGASQLGGALGKQLLPAVILVPLALGWIAIEIENAGWTDGRTALALFALANILILACVVWRAVQVVGDLEHKLRRREKIYESVTTNALDAFVLVDGDGRIIDWNPQAERAFGWRRDEVLGRLAREVVMPPETHAQHAAGLEQVRAGGEYELVGRRVETSLVRKDGSAFRAEMIAVPLRLGKDIFFASFSRDLTELRRAEEQLRQAQKMEAVGQLTGGIAHDFNNTLTAIVAMLDTVHPRVSDELRPRVKMALDAADRGAEMVRQLLAFSRRQVLAPERLELNTVVAGMEDVLRATLGAQVQITLKLKPDLPLTSADRHQVENAVLNLAINARDAMPNGGKLTIETKLIDLDRAYADRNSEVTPGRYVMVAVSDTGIGMSPEVTARVFEPFFSTKDVNAGSGLGLSMVHGFAKQSGGHVKIYSEVGQGTTVRLYLPLIEGLVGADNDDRTQIAPATTGGAETILVVEDDALVRDAAVLALRDLGYTVIEASDGAEAKTVLTGDTHIDLLFTDVVMPGGMTGRMLADEAQRLRPGLRVLFTSGYTDNTIVHHGRLDPGVRFIAKPYRTRDLAAQIRSVLDAGAPETSERAVDTR